MLTRKPHRVVFGEVPLSRANFGHFSQKDQNIPTVQKWQWQRGDDCIGCGCNIGVYIGQ